MAGTANSLAWLAWLRGTELFSLGPHDVDVTLPGDGGLYDLPPLIGVLHLRLLAETKSNRLATADVVIAFLSAMGIRPGPWIIRLLHLRQTLHITWPWLFHSTDGARWTSTFFRRTYLLPSLEAQRLAGDPYLAPYTGAKGLTLAEHFWSMHCYRRGGRTQVTKPSNGAVRKATELEILEHGRWRYTSAVSMSLLYNEWTVADRLAITQLCM